MGRTSGQSAAARQALLALLLTAVLAAAAGAAWLLQEITQRRVDKAAAILKQIRSSKLALYWPDRRQTDWYLIQQDSTVLGWRATVREGSGRGSFRGWEIELGYNQSGATELEMHSAWKLNAGATDGTYQSRVEGRGRPTQLIQIRLQESASEADQATVEVLQPTLALEAQSPEPRNYIPEGVLRLAIRLVAESGADAQFKMVFDDIPNRHKVVEFGSVRISHEGRGRTDQGEQTHRVRVYYRGWGKHPQEYELDESGKPISIVSGNVRWVAASAADVAKRFPDAPETVRRLAQPRPGTEEQTPRRRGLFLFR